MKILITGTHFTPAQAVMEKLRQEGDIQIVYVGRKTTMEGDKTPSAESQLIQQLNEEKKYPRVKFIPIIAGRLKKDFSILTIISWLKIPLGFIQAFWVVLTESPDVVVSFGGYLAVPVVFAAWLQNIPILIHDQTLVFGLSSTVSAFFATKVAVSFNHPYPVPKSKMLVTGNPIRQDFFMTETKLIKSKLPLVLITGGNQGSHFLNQLIAQILPELTHKYLVVHQTGDSKYHDFNSLLEQKKALKNSENYELEKFIPAANMVQIMRQASLVVCRAGANTLLELSYLGTPTLIIPVPYVQKDEQTINAKFFAAAGLGEYLSQNGLTAEKLLHKIEEIISHKHYQTAAKNAHSVVILDAAAKLVQEILILGNEIEKY